MTDERSNVTDDAWIDALEGKSTNDADEARLIRASIEAQDELTSERIGDQDVEAARRKLMSRLGAEDGEAGGEDGEPGDEATPAESTVVDLSARRPPSAKRSIWQQHPAMLLAASVAFVAIVVMVLRNPDIPDGPTLILSYDEIDTLRGAEGEILYPVQDPDAFGRELGARLTEREVPFALSTVAADSPDRILIIQVDGVPNVAGVQDTLNELDLDLPSTSILTIRLVPE